MCVFKKVLIFCLKFERIYEWNDILALSTDIVDTVSLLFIYNILLYEASVLLVFGQCRRDNDIFTLNCFSLCLA